MTSALASAKSLLARGWSPTPVAYKGKAPILREWTKHTISAPDLPRHFNGKPLNIGIRLGEPSGGLVDIDLDHEWTVALAPAFLPATDATFGRESNPGSHYLYLCPGAATQAWADVDGSKLVELRSTGAQTVFPPSTHPSGEAIRWEREGDPAPIAPEELSRCAGRLAGAVLLALHWPGEGSRHDAALALAGALLRSGWAQEDAEHFLGVVVEAAGDNQPKDRLDALRDTARNVGDDRAVTGLPTLKKLLGPKVVKRLADWLGLTAPAARLDCTDTANGERFTRDHGDDVRYCYPFKKWFTWDGARWAVDDRGEVDRRAMLTARGILTEAANLRDHRDQQALAKHAIASQSKGRLEAMTWAARPALAAHPTEFDQYPMLLNTTTGTVDLATGQLRPHDRDDYLTKLAPVAFDPEAQCPRWQSFLQQVMDGDEDMVRFLQRAVGYALTGSTTEQCFFVLHGQGQNGKSTFVETLVRMLGDYARPTEFRTLEARKSSEAVRNDLAALAGLRLVSSIEVGRGKRLDEALVKQLTGSDKITARFLYGEFFDFLPTFKLFLATNHKPEIHGIDKGIWRRVMLVPFTVTIPDHQRDKHLPDRLMAELPGIMAWAVEGCLLWQREGLCPPAKVLAATEEYRAESDALSEFLLTTCQKGPDLSVSAAALYVAYEEWAANAGVDPLRQNDFGVELKGRGFRSQQQKVNDKNVRMYHGLGLAMRSDVRRGRVPPGTDLRRDAEAHQWREF